eukprot:1137170-Pelagomonas_calceolata.AAC.9
MGGEVWSQSTESMSTFARQNWCKTGNQTSAVFGHNLRTRSCSAHRLGVPCQVWGPMCGYTHAWGPVKAGSCLQPKILAQCSKPRLNTSRVAQICLAKVRAFSELAGCTGARIQAYLCQ